MTSVATPLTPPTMTPSPTRTKITCDRQDGPRCLGRGSSGGFSKNGVVLFFCAGKGGPFFFCAGKKVMDVCTRPMSSTCRPTSLLEFLDEEQRSAALA
jgi:hypothetical protein